MTYNHTENDIPNNPRWEPFLIAIGIMIVLGLITVANYLMTHE